MKKTIILFFVIALVSCKKDDNVSISEPELSETEIDLVTGVNLRQFPAQAPLTLGNPNVYLNNQFTVYPNPARHLLSINSFESISDVWILPVMAEKIFQQSEFNTILNSGTYTESQIDSKAELKVLDENSNSLDVTLENLAPGYYKVFVKINGSFYWDNICVSGENFELEDLMNFWE